MHPHLESNWHFQQNGGLISRFSHWALVLFSFFIFPLHTIKQTHMHTASWQVSNLMKVLQSDAQVWLQATNTSPEITVQLSSICHTQQMWINCGRTLEGNNVIKDHFYLTPCWPNFTQESSLFSLSK